MTALRPSRFFPPAEEAGRQGLVGVGGELSIEWLVDAYCHGIFPWPTGDERLAWWSPNPRATIERGELHIARRLRRTWRSGRFEVTCDRDFRGTISGCATAQVRRDNTWITPQMMAAYCHLHEAGFAHSVEVWHAGELAGGIYGVAIGGMFAGESMFYRVRDASKIALVNLAGHLEARGYQLFDIQQLTPHSERLGAALIPRNKFLQRVAAAIELPITFGSQLLGSEIWQRE
ncbi:MAG TPA: leucyl/phenylalanyl-tRNA--protein transferase [Pirellulales bacterium]|jgi:leucyl/phenylalanyl-tRNA--protein transferase|nr:leucyl/phenylalanyl-tRNA--protein transferase [Pirellulales bacterium]